MKSDVIVRGESKAWRPSRWTSTKLERFMMHVKKHALKQVDITLCARINSELNEIRTVSALRARGVKLVGDR